jgi:DNA-binding SARP family transcriptional activator
MNLPTRHASFRYGYLCLVLTTELGVAMGSPASAVISQRSAVDRIGQEFTLRISNPADGVSLPSIAFIQDAELSTTAVTGESTPVPKGKIYLTFSATSGPKQSSYGQVNWGHFFTTMTPLVPSTITFTDRAGQRYVAKQSNPINQASNPNATSDDGLLDAKYWFVVPSNTRAGTISIGPATTQGMEDRGFVGQSIVPLRVAGPISFKVSFPRRLTAPIAHPAETRPAGTYQASPASYSALNEVLTVFSLMFFGYIFWQIRRRTKRRVRYVPVFSPPTNSSSDASPPTPSQYRPATITDQAVRPVHPTAPPAQSLRVNVLGSLQIEPSTKGASDPIRAVIAYLAVHDDRPQSGDEIQTALWPESMKVTSVSQKTFLNYVSRARNTVGPQHLPDASGRSGYELIDTTSDWREFRNLAIKANSAAKNEAIELRRSALKLVRGVPFEGELSTFFEWSVSQKYATNMIELVTSVAHMLQADLVSLGDLDGASWAIDQAMLVAPTEMPLWRDLVDICEARGEVSVMERFWQDAEKKLWPAAIKELRARLVG